MSGSLPSEGTRRQGSAQVHVVGGARGAGGGFPVPGAANGRGDYSYRLGEGYFGGGREIGPGGTHR